jgi:hypothetical protein
VVVLSLGWIKSIVIVQKKAVLVLVLKLEPKMNSVRRTKSLMSLKRMI